MFSDLQFVGKVNAPMYKVSIEQIMNGIFNTDLKLCQFKSQQLSTIDL